MAWWVASAGCPLLPGARSAPHSASFRTHPLPLPALCSPPLRACSTVCLPSTWPAPSVTCPWTSCCPRCVGVGATCVWVCGCDRTAAPALTCAAPALTCAAPALTHPMTCPLQLCITVVYFMGGLRYNVWAFLGQTGTALLAMLVAQSIGLLLGCITMGERPAPCALRPAPGRWLR